MRRTALALAAALLAASAAAAQQAQHVDASSGVVSNAIATATLPADQRQLWVTGLEITGEGATAASCVAATLAGLQSATGNLSYAVCAPAGITTAITPVIIQFAPPRPAKTNTAVVLTVPALGAGNTGLVANLHGFYQNQ